MYMLERHQGDVSRTKFLEWQRKDRFLKAPGAWQVWTKMFQRWGPFLKNMYLILCQFSKKNLIRYVLWKVSNFALIFYVMSVLHKKSKQSLRLSTGRIGWDFFSKIGIEWGTYFFKKAPNFEIIWPAPATPRVQSGMGKLMVGCVCTLFILICHWFVNGV